MTACLTFDQALAKQGKEQGLDIRQLNAVRRQAKDAADDLIAPIKGISRREQVAVAEALIETFAGVLDDCCKVHKRLVKEYDPNQPRDERGRWTLGGAASAAAGVAGRAAVAGGGALLHIAREALSTVTLVPSSKVAVSESLKSWWARVQSSDVATRITAVEEAGARTIVTIIVGAAMLALAHAFIGSAAGAVGAAVGQALRVLLGR